MALGMGQLGWPPAVFWDSTLPELLMAAKGHDVSEHARYWQTGEIIAAVYNVERDTKKHGMLSAPDIFPFLLTPKQWVDKAWAKINVDLITEEDDER